MRQSRSGYLKFRKKDRNVFLSEMNRLNTRGKKILQYSDMDTWDGFYYHLFIKRDVKDLIDLRNSGVKTRNELITLMRKILDPHGNYNKAIERFDAEYNKLDGRTKTILRSNGISMFETFFYSVIVKRKAIDFGYYPSSGNVYIAEAEEFVKSVCNFLGKSVPHPKNKIYFNPDNPGLPFVPKQGIKKTFASEFACLSESTKSYLTNSGASNLEGFYTSYIAEDSPFNEVFNEIGESNLLEILKFRSMINGKIKK